MPYALNSQQFFDERLQPLMRVKYPSVKIRYELVYVNEALAGHEYVVKVKLHGHLGLEPYATRHSCNDDPEMVAKFLQEVASGKLHISCWQYLLGPYTQYLIKTGKRPGYPAMMPRHKYDSDRERTPTERIELAVAQAEREDKDLVRVARKRDYDREFVEKVLGKKDYLLEKM